MVSTVKPPRYVTYIGYFGPTTNVRDTGAAAPSLSALTQSILSVPTPRQRAIARELGK